jgi:predicted acylesterase/phospholipase RssA
MGVTFIHKSDLSRPHPNPRIALVLAGGAVSGGAFKLGGLIALNSYLKNTKVNHFQVYTGISAGAMLAAPLAAGIPVEELLKSVYGLSDVIPPITPLDFYYPNWREFLTKGARFSRDSLRLMPQVGRSLIDLVMKRRRDLTTLARKFLQDPSLTNAELLLFPFVHEVTRHPASIALTTSYWPSGICSNARLESYVARTFEKNRLPNNFRLLKRLRNRDLYIVATDLNRAEPVVFGWDEDNSVSISEAVQASTALPILYRPAAINGNEYIDAAIVKTAHVSLAVAKKADLIIAYNPFRPFVGAHQGLLDPRFEGLGQMGIFTVLNQAFRTLLHSRLLLSLERIKQDPAFHGDILLFEPVETDRTFFEINPVAFWKMAASASHGFVSVKESIERHHDRLRPIFYHYGVETDLAGLRTDFDAISQLTEKRDDLGLLERLGVRQVPRRLRHLRAVA